MSSRGEKKVPLRSDIAPAGADRERTSRRLFHKMPQRRARGHIGLGVSESQHRQLSTWARSRTVPHRLVTRSRIVLLAAKGLSVTAIAAQLQIARSTVLLWCHRFREGGVEALRRDAPGRGRKAGVPAARVTAIVRAIRQQLASGQPLTVRATAARSGMSVSTVWRIWKRYIAHESASGRDASTVRRLISETELHSE